MRPIPGKGWTVIAIALNLGVIVIQSGFIVSTFHNPYSARRVAGADEREENIAQREANS